MSHDLIAIKIHFRVIGVGHAETCVHLAWIVPCVYVCVCMSVVCVCMSVVCVHVYCVCVHVCCVCVHVCCVCVHVCCVCVHVCCVCTCLLCVCACLLCVCMSVVCVYMFVVCALYSCSFAILIELEALSKQPHGAETGKVFTLMSRSDATFLATMIATYNEDYEVSVSRDQVMCHLQGFHC